MIIDDSKFPIVFVDFQHTHNHTEEDGHDHTEDMEAFTNLFERGQPFVMISISASEMPEEMPKRSREEIKRVNAWRKIYKEKLKYTKATIQVEPSKVKRLGFKLFANTYEKFWGNPLLFAETKEEALKMAEKTLNEALFTTSVAENK